MVATVRLTVCDAVFARLESTTRGQETSINCVYRFSVFILAGEGWL
jgi:hypothetical protein